MTSSLPLDQIICGDNLETMRTWPSNSVHCCVTSPPYWGLRDYGHDGQIGLEDTPEAYVAIMVEVFREVRRILRDDGTLWLNLGDSYATPKVGNTQSSIIGKSEMLNAMKFEKKLPPGLKPKDLVGIPWRVAFALQADGWWLRQDIIWHKPNPMPESVTDRCCKAHEYLFLLTKSARYYFDNEAIKEPSTTGDTRKPYGSDGAWAMDGRNKWDEGKGQQRDNADGATRTKRSVWTITTKPFTGWTKTDHWERVEADAACDDMKRTASEGCPVHGCQGRPSDERAGGLSIRSDSTSRHPDESPQVEHSASSTHHGEPMTVSNSDSLAQQTGPSASSHSIEMSRTPHAIPHASERDTPSAQTQPRSDGTESLCESFEQHHGKRESKTAASETGESPSSRMTAGTLRTQDEQGVSVASYRSLVERGCTCSFYRKVTKETSHFAVMPPDLVEPCIKAGTSEEGCCSVCGAPWERVVEREREFTRTIDDDPKYAEDFKTTARTKVGLVGRPIVTKSETIGWRPACTCGGSPVPCIVLDPFMGSGTVAMVARNLSCRYIGCELNPEYVEISNKRLQQNLLF